MNRFWYVLKYGVLGNQIGGGSGRTAATVIGAIGGGFLRNEIEKKNYSQKTAVELQVRVDQTGQYLTFTQQDNGERFSNGSRVRLVYENNSWRAIY